MTYSPQLILNFNQDLAFPELKVALHPDVEKELKNKHTLENVLWETNMIRLNNNMHYSDSGSESSGLI